MSRTVKQQKQPEISFAAVFKAYKGRQVFNENFLRGKQNLKKRKIQRKALKRNNYGLQYESRLLMGGERTENLSGVFRTKYI